MTDKRYLTRASIGNVIFITVTVCVHVASWVLFLVTILFLDLVRLGNSIHQTRFEKRLDSADLLWIFAFYTLTKPYLACSYEHFKVDKMC